MILRRRKKWLAWATCWVTLRQLSAMTLLLSSASFAGSDAAMDAEDTRPLVRLGPGQITLADLDASAMSIPSERRAGFFRDPQRISSHLETLVVRRALVVQALEDPLVSELNLGEVHHQLVQEKLVEEQFRQLLEALPEPDYARRARELYDLNIEDFRLAEAVSVSHILVDTKDRSDADALELAQSILKIAREGTPPFSDLVAQYSDDPGKASNQGRYQRFVRGSMVKPFEDASFAMTEPGEIAGPVKTRFGYHVILFHERVVDSYQSYEQAELSLLDRAKKELKQQQRDELLASFEDPQHDLLALARENHIGETPLFQAIIRLQADETIMLQYKAAYLADKMPASVETLAREQYRTKRSHFFEPTTVTIQLLYVDSSEIGVESAASRARDLAAKARDPQIKFEQLIEDFSDDPRKFKTGGKYLYEAGKSENRVAKHALEMTRIGEIVGPLEWESGFDLIKLLSRREAGHLDFEQVKDGLMKAILGKLKQRLWDARVSAVMQLQFWADQELVHSVRDRYLPNAQ